MSEKVPRLNPADSSLNQLSSEANDASTPLLQPKTSLPPVGWRTHIRVVIAFVLCFFSSGALMAFPTIEPLLIKAQLFEAGCPPKSSDPPICSVQTEKLSTLFIEAQGLSGAFIIVAGLLFDRTGARFVAVLGSFLAAAGQVLCFVAIRWAVVDWIAFVGLPLSDSGAILNSMAIFGFLYHYPTLQAFVIGIADSSQLASSLMGYVLVWWNDSFGIPVEWGMLLLAALSIMAGVFSYYIIPSPTEYYERAQEVLGTSTANSEPPLNPQT